MSGRLKVCTCQQCGRGFVLTSTYLELLDRRQANVIVPVLCPTCFLTKGALPKQRGKVKWFNPSKRFGFIVTEAGEEIFVHQEQLVDISRKSLQGGQEVCFHVHYPVKGPEALNVELFQQ
jgi:CspA family cold shock protein